MEELWRNVVRLEMKQGELAPRKVESGHHSRIGVRILSEHVLFAVGRFPDSSMAEPCALPIPPAVQYLDFEQPMLKSVAISSKLKYCAIRNVPGDRIQRIVIVG